MAVKELDLTYLLELATKPGMEQRMEIHLQHQRSKEVAMALIMEGLDPKWFQENMGRGGAIPLGKKSAQEQPNLPTQKQTDNQEKE